MTTTPAPMTMHVASAVTCPTCAAVNGPCRTAAGRRATAPHAARVRAARDAMAFADARAVAVTADAVPTPAAPAPCAHEGAHHSEDRVTVHYGGPAPVTLCGYHTAAPIDYGRVRRPDGGPAPVDVPTPAPDGGPGAPYVADRPMPSGRVVPGAFVYVPVWSAGTVTGWDYGRVTNMPALPAGAESFWVVEVAGRETSYFGYSIMCGVCHGRDDVTCHQCAPGAYDVTAGRAVARPVAAPDTRCGVCHRDAHRPGRGGDHGHAYEAPVGAAPAAPFAMGARVVVTVDGRPARGRVARPFNGQTYLVNVPGRRPVVVPPSRVAVPAG